MDKVGLDAVGFAHEAEEEVTDYRSLNRLALAGAIVGAFAWLALLAPLLWIVPAISIVMCLIALRQINVNPGMWTGRRWALAGLVLATFLGGWGVAREVTRQRTISNQAHQYADEVIRLVQNNERLSVHQLSLPKPSRLTPGADLSEFYAAGSERKAEYESYFDGPPLKAMIEAGKSGEYEFKRVALMRNTPTEDHADVHYRFSYPSGKAKRSVEIVIQLRRYWNPEKREGDWQLTGIRQRSL